MKKASGRVAFTGLLAALALSFSFLEGLIPPIPVLPPGAKLGLSNIVVLYAAGSLGAACGAVPGLPEGGLCAADPRRHSGPPEYFRRCFERSCHVAAAAENQGLALSGGCVRRAFPQCCAALRGLVAHFGCCGILSAFFSFVRRVNRSAHRTGAEAYPAAAAKN